MMSEELTRRAFQHGLGSIILGGTLVSTCRAAADDEAPGGSGGETEICNFPASFMTWDLPYRKDPRPYARHNIPHGNMARIQLEALIDVTDQARQRTQRFALIAPCRTEWVYAEDRLFQIPSREYRTINSATHERSMGSAITFDGTVYRGRAATENYRSMKVDVQTFPVARRLDDAAAIVKATAQNIPLVARTVIQDPTGEHRFALQYPIRTMNFQPQTDSFQVDTGPILVPDYKAQAEHWIDRLEMAHVAYNQLDRAEFILRRPTPVNDASGKQLCQTLYYSEVREDPAVTQLFTGEAG